MTHAERPAQSDQPLETRRLRWLRLARLAMWLPLLAATLWVARREPAQPALPPGVVSHTGLRYAPARSDRCRLDLYLPQRSAPVGGWPIVLAIHGGGWRGGSRGDFAATVLPLVPEGMAVAVIDYTLSAPGRPSWPANRDDTREAVRWLKRNAARYSLDSSRVAAIGASAGGHLAALLGTDPGSPETQISAVVSLYGPTDLNHLGAACELPGGPLELLLGRPPATVRALAAAASPLAHVTPDDSPMLLIHGRRDRLVPPQQADLLAQRLTAVGVPCEVLILEDAKHGFGLQLPQHDLVPRVLAFLNLAWKDNYKDQSVSKPLAADSSRSVWFQLPMRLPLTGYGHPIDGS